MPHYIWPRRAFNRRLEGQHDPEGRDIRAASVTDACRFTFAIDKDTETCILYRAGPHDIERRPY